MAVYGVDFYGLGRFGRDPAMYRPDFSVDPFRSTPLDYSTLHLTWHQPASTDCVYLRLVRNTHNLPQDEDDGIYVWGDNTTTPPFSDVVSRVPAYTDIQLGQGFYYYTMWGWSQTSQMWVRCSDLVALVPIPWGYGWKLYSLLPMAYRDRDIVLVDPYNPWPVDGPQPPLQRYLNLLGFQLDFIRTELESLMSINDPINCSGSLLPLLAQQVGLTHEPEIGMQQQRQLIQNAIHLYKAKGSPRGITEFTSIMTSYPTTMLVHHGYNLMLTRDDSVGQSSTGTWQTWPPAGSNFPPVTGNVGVSGDFVPNLMNAGISGMTDPLGLYPGIDISQLRPPYTSSGIQIQGTGTNVLTASQSSFEDGTTGGWVAGANTTISNNPNMGSGGGPIVGVLGSPTPDAPSTHSLQLNSTRQNNTVSTHLSVSLSPSPPSGATYLISADFQSLGTNRDVYLSVQFFNASGGSLGAVVNGAQQLEATGEWVTADIIGTVPAANAASATITATILNCANGEDHVMDNVWAGRGGQDIWLTTGGIPITDFISQDYSQPGAVTWRFQIWSATARQIETSIWADSGSGTPIQVAPATGAPPQSSSVAQGWKMFTITGQVNPYPNGVNPPSGVPASASYYWIYPRIRIINAGTESHYLTLMGVWTGSPGDIGVNTSSPAYDYPRDVKVILQPQFANLLPNTLTTFTRLAPNPSPPPQTVTYPIGFDGLSALVNPADASTALSGSISIRYQTAEDPAGFDAVNGNASLQVGATSNTTVWFGTIPANGWTNPASIPSPNGWFAGPRPVTPTAPAYKDGKTNDWFPGEIPGSAKTRPWFDPVESWHFINQQFFGVGTGIQDMTGIWFPPTQQPQQNNNLLPFNVQNGQAFNFSVYARYLSVLDPSNAIMLLGFRWIYPDGTYTDDITHPEKYSTNFTITGDWVRYAVAPSDATAYLSEPPAQPLTGILPIQVYPFVRFPAAQQAQFLLNSAMLSPGLGTPSYIDSTSFPANLNFIPDYTYGAAYYYRRLVPRTQRLISEIYRWLPMGSSYTMSFGAGATTPPIDPTRWLTTKPTFAAHTLSNMTVNPS